MLSSLKYLREQNDYSQNTVADFLGISRQMYIKYEKGEVDPPVRIIEQLAKLYKVTYDVIFNENLSSSNNHSDIQYKITDASPLEFHDSGASNSSSYYFNAILNMLPKLIFNEKLKVLSTLLEIVQKETEVQYIPNKKINSFNKILELSNTLKLKSDGKKWTREEIYER